MWHLAHRHQVTVSAATVSRYLSRGGLVTPEPGKRPKSSYIRFEASLPNECWQSDFTRYPLAGGTATEILTWLDDRSRLALSVTAHARVTSPIVLAAFRAAVAARGVPASTLTDNGMVFTTRPKAAPGNRSGDTHDRVRTDRVHAAGTVTLRTGGRLHHIGVGRTYAGTSVLLIVQDLNIRIIDAATGELLRALTLDPARDYQPTGRPPGPQRKTPRA